MAIISEIDGAISGAYISYLNKMAHQPSLVYRIPEKIPFNLESGYKDYKSYNLVS